MSRCRTTITHTNTNPESFRAGGSFANATTCDSRAHVTSPFRLVQGHPPLVCCVWVRFARPRRHLWAINPSKLLTHVRIYSTARVRAKNTICSNETTSLTAAGRLNGATKYLSDAKRACPEVELELRFHFSDCCCPRVKRMRSRSEYVAHFLVSQIGCS